MPELELYHNDMSSCSQKVRLTLEEKNLTWKGHHMNLRKGETRSIEYISKSRQRAPWLIQVLSAQSPTKSFLN